MRSFEIKQEGVAAFQITSAVGMLRLGGRLSCRSHVGKRQSPHLYSVQMGSLSCHRCAQRTNREVSMSRIQTHRLRPLVRNMCIRLAIFPFKSKHGVLLPSDRSRISPAFSLQACTYQMRRWSASQVVHHNRAFVYTHPYVGLPCLECNQNRRSLP